MLVSRVSHNEKVQYHQLTDKAVPIDDFNNENPIETYETEIDPLAPKGKQMIPIAIFYEPISTTIGSPGSVIILISISQKFHSCFYSQRYLNETFIDHLKIIIQHVVLKLIYF